MMENKESEGALDGNVYEGNSKKTLDGVRIAIDARKLRHPGMGIHTYMAAGIKLLVEQGSHVSLLANFDRGKFAEEFSDTRWESFGSKRDIIWDQLSLPRKLRDRKFDFYWAPGNNGIPWRSIGRTIKVSTTHDIIPLRFPSMYLRHNLGFALPYFVWTLSAVLRSDVLLTVSQASADDIFRFFRKRSIVISPTFSIAGPSANSELPSKEGLDYRYIIYTGGMDPRKNVRILLEAFALAASKVPDLRLTIVGHSTEQLVPLIKGLKLEDRVTLTGLVSEQEKFVLLKGASALVYPSLYEGFGLPILEAFSADVPVLTCRNSSLLEVAADAAIYVDPNSPSSIAFGISSILEDDVAESLRVLGRARLKHYDSVVTRQKLVDVFGMQRINRGL